MSTHSTGERVVERFGCSRVDVVGFAEALIVALIEILEKLRHEAIPEEKTWRVELNDMVDFLMDPKNRDNAAFSRERTVRQCRPHWSSASQQLKIPARLLRRPCSCLNMATPARQ
ncbi:hypothetical protein MRX96_017303 [Rhipicephalus microplus]